MSRKMLLPALLTTALVAVPGMLSASQAKPCQSGFFLSAGVGMVNHNLKLTKTADQVKANAKTAFEALRDGLAAKVSSATAVIYDNAAFMAALPDLAKLAAKPTTIIISGNTIGGLTGINALPEVFVVGQDLYIVVDDQTAPGATSIADLRKAIKEGVLGVYNISTVKIIGLDPAAVKTFQAPFADADKPNFADAKLDQLKQFLVADKDITLYQTSNGKEVSTYTSPKGVAFQLMGGYRHTLGNNMAAALAAYFGFGLGNGRNSKAGETEELKTKERFHYGLELHLGAYVTPTTFLFAKGVIESTSFKFANYNKVGTQTKPDTKDGHAHTTHFRPGMGVGMTTNIQKNLGVGIDYTYLFNSGGKDLKVGGSDAAGTEMKVGRIKGDTHRVMLRLIWTI